MPPGTLPKPEEIAMTNDAPICPRCERISLAQKTKYGVRHSCCGLWSWGGKPLVGAETHEARKAAHAAFDTIWQGGHMSRSYAYEELARRLRISPQECHIAQFDVKHARLTIEIATDIMMSKLREKVDT